MSLFVRGCRPWRRRSLLTRYAPTAVSTVPVHFLCSPILKRLIAQRPQRSQKVNLPLVTRMWPESTSLVVSVIPSSLYAVGRGCLPISLLLTAPLAGSVVPLAAAAAMGLAPPLHSSAPAACISSVLYACRTSRACRIPRLLNTRCCRGPLHFLLAMAAGLAAGPKEAARTAMEVPLASPQDVPPD